MTRLFIEASRVDKSSRQPQRDMSYAAIPDLWEQYHPGDELTCVVKQFDRKAGTFEISSPMPRSAPVTRAVLPFRLTRSIVKSAIFIDFFLLIPL